MVGMSSPVWFLFHGSIAVAPLKHHERGRHPRRCNLFHGSIAVAPLKLEGAEKKLDEAGLFHGSIAVAPLKREWNRLVWRVPIALPRLHRRGPIEATPGDLPLARPWPSSTAPSPWPH